MAKKILICDDDPSVRNAFKAILENTHDLILCENCQQCLETLRHNQDIGILFLDIKLPETNGLELLQKIKAQAPQIPVVVLTGYDTPELREKMLHLGAKAYLNKPFSPEEIRKAVDAFCPTPQESS